MVAPTRTPQARGVKCDLCKKILSLATWLDQTKLAKDVDDAHTVLSLIKQHESTECPCIPKNIENLLIGSTHFEIHRLLAKHLDAQTHQKQHVAYLEAKQRLSAEASRRKYDIINDCADTSKISRFKVYLSHIDKKYIKQSEQQLQNLCSAIDYWRFAMEDQTNPFNSKLALRLGLTHHIIYACYLFKYFKLLDYQLITANLLLNVFRSIEGVTPNAILHANFLLVKSLLDCDQLSLARQQLRQAIKLNIYQEKSYYESILLHCVACEIEFLTDREGVCSLVEELSELAVIKPDDKLQHYYARTLAMSIVLKFIHRHASKSDFCFEFFHSFRFISAIMRRCYESAFELVLAEKDITTSHSKESVDRQNQIIDHSWIRYAVCDFVYTTFDNLADFYKRGGIPEYLELLYNGLSLVAFRCGSIFWQSRIVEIGVRLDIFCDKYDQAKEKLDILSRQINYTDDPCFMNLLRLESEVTSLALMQRQNQKISLSVIYDMIERVESCKSALLKKLDGIELFDSKSDTVTKISCSQKQSSSLSLMGHLNKVNLMIVKMGIEFMIATNSLEQAFELLNKVNEGKVYDYFEKQILLETLIQFASVDKVEQRLLSAINNHPIFLKCDNEVSDLYKHLSNLTLGGVPTNTTESLPQSSFKLIGKSTKIDRKSRKKGVYNVNSHCDEHKFDHSKVNHLSISEMISDMKNLSTENIASLYLRHSEPNPDFLLYRRAHEVLLYCRLNNEHVDEDSILYHFVESSSSNSMRYRWMMFEEQQLSPYESATDESSNIRASNVKCPSRLLSFCNSLLNYDKTLKSMTRALPDGYRLVQLKYVLDSIKDRENIICVSLNNSGEHIYVHAQRSLVNDFYDDPSIPRRLSKKIEESRRSLLKSQQSSKSDLRNKIESDIEIILSDIENDWLGPFRFILSGDICDVSYNKFIEDLAGEIQRNVMSKKQCRSNIMLKFLLSNAPLLSRQDFCRVAGILFNCSDLSNEIRDCFNKWLKSIESYMEENNLGLNKVTALQQIERGQMGLILDTNIEHIPFEALPFIRVVSQGIFRIPSLRLFTIIANRHCSQARIDPKEIAYVLDPAYNLAKTRERFEKKLVSQSAWQGVIGRAPSTADLERWLTEKHMYLFIGHGAGTTYYNRLGRGRGLSSLAHIESVAVVMGCSSGRMISEGPQLETFGIGWVFIIRGSPCYMGLLWDVTDNDIDKYLDALLDKWIPSLNWLGTSRSVNQRSNIALTNASIQARQVCRLKLLVGSASVVYGLPVWSKV